MSVNSTHTIEKTLVRTDIWTEFLSIVKEEAGSRVVDTWFKAVSLRKWDAAQNIVYLEAPNEFVKDWIQSKYMALMQMHLGRLLNVSMPRIAFTESVVHTAEKEEHDAQVVSDHKAMTVMPAISQQTHAKNELVKRAHSFTGHVNHTYSFDNFVVGPNNSLAYAAAHAVTERPGMIYNPLFIYGGSGLGKTHLLHAIGNEIKAKNKDATILYQTADRFVNEFISAIRFDKIHKFQEKYKSIDVLLIDDIQFISNKDQTQEAFFHIFNALYDAHKQIVFSSDVVPNDIKGIAERLRSRLACGLVTDIYLPPLETKIAILKTKAESMNGSIDDTVAHFIASQVDSNIRELEGALIRVIAFSSLTNQEITLALAQKVLASTHKPQSMTVDVDRVLKCVSKFYSYDRQELTSKNRNKDLTHARQVAMFLMKKMTDKSLRDIGIVFGGRDHSTVMHAVSKIEERVHKDEEFVHTLKKMEEDIRL